MNLLYKRWLGLGKGELYYITPCKDAGHAGDLIFRTYQEPCGFGTATWRIADIRQRLSVDARSENPVCKLLREFAAPGDKAVVFEAGFAVGEGDAGQGLHAAAGSIQYGLAGRGVPLHCCAETRVEVALAGGDHAEFQRAAAALARLHRIIPQKLGEPPAVLVRAAVDDDEPVRRCARTDRLGGATAAAAGRRPRTTRRVGQTDRRPMHDAEYRPPFLDKRNQHRELTVPGDELARAVERVDRPEAVAAGRHSLGLAQFLGDARNVGKGRHQPVDDDPLGGEVGLGHRGLVGLVANVELFGIDLEDRLAGDDRRPAHNIEHFLTVGAHAAF